MYPSIVDILKINDTSILISKINSRSDIVIGVPHHTPLGTYMMPCESHKYGDQNTGYIGFDLSKNLNSNFLCACNYFIDSNKKYDNNLSDYYKALEKCNPRYLVEIHGHGIEHCGDDIEISSGCKNDEVHALRLKEEIIAVIDKRAKEDRDSKKVQELKNLNINAEFDKIHYKAARSSTIIDNRWISYHIELPLILRIGTEDGRLPEIGFEFANVLYEAIKNIKYKGWVKINYLTQ